MHFLLLFISEILLYNCFIYLLDAHRWGMISFSLSVPHLHCCTDLKFRSAKVQDSASRTKSAFVFSFYVYSQLFVCWSFLLTSFIACYIYLWVPRFVALFGKFCRVWNNLMTTALLTGLSSRKVSIYASILFRRVLSVLISAMQRDGTLPSSFPIFAFISKAKIVMPRDWF